ncbi:hypothetical protein [Tessaracoccus terricola]
MTSLPEQHPSWESFPWRSCLTLVLYMALLGFVWMAAAWTGLGRVGLETVSYTMELDVALVPLWVQLVFIVLTAAGVALLAVFPVGESVGWVRVPQLFGALWIAGWLALLSRVRSGAEFVMPDHGECLRVDCWPLGYQELVIAAPLAVAVLLLAAMAFFTRLSWQAQAFVPAGVYLTLALLQRAVWDVQVLPLLSTAPPG